MTHLTLVCGLKSNPLIREKQSGAGNKPSSVRRKHLVVIQLRPLSREASSDLPGSTNEPERLFSPTWSCFGQGLPVRGNLFPRRWSLTPPFHPCSKEFLWSGLLSVALSVGSLRPPVRRCPAQRSSDFLHRYTGATTCLLQIILPMFHSAVNTNGNWELPS